MTDGAWENARIGDYRCVAFLGAGGMGEVYRAVEESTGRVVALKLLLPARRDPALVRRFRNEARIHATLQHPHIGAMYAFLDLPDCPVIVMEYVDGTALDQQLKRRGPPPLPETLRLAGALVDAVGHMHRRGILHRDLKTTNVKVTHDGVLKLLDFGIAKDPGSPALTATGNVIGTLHSLSPEQLAGAPATTQSEIWSLGVVIYEITTGRHPFADGDTTEITARILAGRYAPPSRVATGLPAALDAVIARCLKVDPRRRYESCEALAHALEQVATAPARPAPISSDLHGLVRPTRTKVAGVAALALLTLAVLARDSTDPANDTVVVPAIPAAVASDAALRTVTIDVVGGRAEVWRGDSLLGRTPYQLRARLGEHVSLELRRAGSASEAVEFDVTEGRTAYSYVLRAGRPTSQLPAAPLGWAAFGWLAWPWRRRRSAIATTMELGTRGSGALPIDTRIVIGSATDPGCVRQGNEDAFRIVRPEGEGASRTALLAVVCDGMGGHEGGEVASQLATDVIGAEFRSGSEPGEAIAKAVRAANRAIFKAAQERPALTGMGTTCTALVVRAGQAWCAHVGDSRCYLIRGAGIYQMTDDHSSVMAMVRDGALSADEARSHPDKNVILRALGSHKEVEVSTWPRPFVLQHGDRFLLCSDGLYDVLTDPEILAAVDGHPPQQGCDALIALARERGAPDNVTVIILAVPEQRTQAVSRETRPVGLAS